MDTRTGGQADRMEKLDSDGIDSVREQATSVARALVASGPAIRDASTRPGPDPAQQIA